MQESWKQSFESSFQFTIFTLFLLSDPFCFHVVIVGFCFKLFHLVSFSTVFRQNWTTVLWRASSRAAARWHDGRTVRWVTNTRNYLLTPSTCSQRQSEGLWPHTIYFLLGVYTFLRFFKNFVFSCLGGGGSIFEKIWYTMKSQRVPDFLIM